MKVCSSTNNSKFRCRTCTKNVYDSNKAVQCDLCEHWIPIKCNNLSYLDYRYLRACNELWYCIEWSSNIFQYLSCDKNFLACCTNTDSSIIPWKGQKTGEISSLLLETTQNLELLVYQFNNATPENNNDPENIVSSKYYDIDEMHNVGISNKNNYLSLFRINACSLINILMIFKVI